MKQSTWLAMAIGALLTSITVSSYAASAPTYDDQLIVKNPVVAPTLGTVVLVPVASPQTKAAVHDYVMAWQHANERIAVAKAKAAANEKLTDADIMWLHSMDRYNYADYFRTHSIGRVHGYEVAMNWNAENFDKNDYEYFYMPKFEDNNEFVNSYGFNTLRGMVDKINEVIQKQKKSGGPMTVEEAIALEKAILNVMSEEQQHVANEELRHYMNETVWFAAKQTVKNKAVDEPDAKYDHVVDLKAAINVPIEN